MKNFFSNQFSILLILIFLFELGIGIAGYIKHNQLKGILLESFNTSLANYGKNKHYTVSWNLMQDELRCCGIKSADDYEKFGIFLNETLPESCCHEYEVKPNQHDDEKVCTKKNAEKAGCLRNLYILLNSRALLLGGIGIGIAAFQILGVIFACCLAKAFRKNYETV